MLASLEGHLLCSIDIETTGDNILKHDIFEFACIPVDENLEVHQHIRPVTLTIKPDRPNNIDWGVMRSIKRTTDLRHIVQYGIDSAKASDIFWEWFNSIGLQPNKRIIPLATNWAGLDKVFIKDWLGDTAFDFIFDGRYRDIMATAAYINDRLVYQNKPKMFENLRLGTICKVLGVELLNAHRAFVDAEMNIRAYKELCRI